MKHVYILPMVLLSLTLYVAVIILGARAPATPQAAAQGAYPAPTSTVAPAYPNPQAAPTAAANPSPSAARSTAAAATVTTTRVMATADARPTMTSTLAPTRVPPTLERQAQVVEPSPTPPGVLTCLPGQTVMVSGVAPPYAPLLLTFGSRVVGGGSARASGEFVLPLSPGTERVGQYTVTVKIRGSQQIVRSLICEVPEITPTPTPPRP